MSILRGALRRCCAGKDRKSYHLTKYFGATEDGRYTLLDQPLVGGPSVYESAARGPGEAPSLVTVPGGDEADPEEPDGGPTHWEIQWRLLDLGARMGFSVWAPLADRGRCWDARRIGDVPGMLERLTLGFDAATMKTIENIDVLWLRRHSIVCGFEVEHTSSIYSGLLRMSDLAAMQPNLTIKFYLVAPDRREEKFVREVARPTFVYGSLTRPLYEVCRFLPYTDFLDYLGRHGNVAHRLSPAWLDDVSVAYNPADAG